MPHSRGLKKADLLIKDFQLQGVRDVIVDVTCRHEFRGSCANQERNGEPSHLDVNGVRWVSEGNGPVGWGGGRRWSGGGA